MEIYSRETAEEIKIVTAGCLCLLPSPSVAD